MTHDPTARPATGDADFSKMAGDAAWSASSASPQARLLLLSVLRGEAQRFSTGLVDKDVRNAGASCGQCWG
jgi:hypothetical protein